MAWIFRSSEPIAERLRENSSDEWPVEQHHSLMSPGDLVFFWEGDATGRIVGMGRIQTQPYRPKTGPRRRTVRVGRSLMLRSPLRAEECHSDPILREIPVLHRDDHTNYGLSRAHSDRLLALIGAREPSLAVSLNMRPSQIPKLGDEEIPEPVQETPSHPATSHTPYHAVFGDSLTQRVEAFLADPATAKAHAMRTAAHARIRAMLHAEVLAEITAEQFQREVMRFGSVFIDDEALPFGRALGRLQDLTADEIAKMLDAGRVRTEGNLTWHAQHPLIGEAGDQRESAALSLRLRAGVHHLLASNRPLASRIDRMRRSFEALWPETATGILMILDPEKHIVYHGNPGRALEMLGWSKPLRGALDGYETYREFVRQFKDEYSFGSNALVDLFLTTLAEPDWLSGGGGQDTTGPNDEGYHTSPPTAHRTNEPNHTPPE